MKNTGITPCNWQLQGSEEFPEELTIDCISGKLDPTKEKIININFKGLSQANYENKLILDVEDTEGQNVK